MISLELRLKNYSSWAFLLSPPKVGASDFNQLVRSSVPDIWRFIRINDFLPKLSPIPPYHVSGKIIKSFKKISTLLSAFWRQRSSYWPNKLCLASAVGDFDSLAFLLRLKSSSFSLLFYVNAYWRTANPCNRDLRTGTGLNMSSKTHRGCTLVVRFCPTDFGGRILPQNKSFPSQTWFFRQKFSDKVVLCVIIYHYIVL